MSPRPLLRVGTSNAVVLPSGAMRSSWSALGSVAHTAPSGAMATPNGAASAGIFPGGGPPTKRGKNPPPRRVTTPPPGSGDHTGVSGPTRRRPHLAPAGPSLDPAGVRPTGEPNEQDRAGDEADHDHECEPRAPAHRSLCARCRAAAITPRASRTTSPKPPTMLPRLDREDAVSLRRTRVCRSS